MKFFFIVAMYFIPVGPIEKSTKAPVMAWRPTVDQLLSIAMLSNILTTYGVTTPYWIDLVSWNLQKFPKKDCAWNAASKNYLYHLRE